MKGQVMFWYRMRRQGESIVAEVLFQTYGQQCNRCQAQGQVVDPFFHRVPRSCKSIINHYHHKSIGFAVANV